MEEYDPQELQELIKEALSETSDSQALLNMGDTVVLEELHALLKEFLHPADITQIVDRLRDTLYKADGRDPKKVLQSLHAVQKYCKLCPNAISEPVLPHWNLSDPDLVLITQHPFGSIPDSELLIDKLKEVGFSSSRIAATSIVRCNTEKITSTNLSNCTSNFLFQEIEALAPRLIMTVGAIATSVFSMEKIKITDVIGSVFWVGPWPVLPVNSPSYAVRSETRIRELASNMQTAYKFIYG